MKSEDKLDKIYEDFFWSDKKIKKQYKKIKDVKITKEIHKWLEKWYLLL